MKGVLKFTLAFVTMFFSGCIFSGSDVEENKIVDNYYISSLAGNNSLVYKEPDAATENILVPTNVDSIGWNDKVVSGVSGGQYFIIDRESQNLNNYKDRLQYIDAYKKFGISDEIQMKKVTGSQIE